MNYAHTDDHFGRQLGRLRRLWKPASIAGLLVLIVGTAIVMLVPSYYESTAVILIEQQQIPQDLVRTTVTGFAEERVQILAHRVMTSTNLMNIIKRHDLYAKERHYEPRELILERMRDDIGLDFISAEVVDPRSNRLMSTTIAFTLSYRSKSPTSAFRVSNELTSLFLSENLKSRTQMTEDTSRFLREESERLESTVNALERKLVDYRKDNFDRLPEFLDSNYQMLGRTDREYEDVLTQLTALDEKIVLLDSRIVQTRMESMGASTIRGQLLSPAQQRLALEAELARAETVYSPTHPDIKRLQRELTALEEPSVPAPQEGREIAGPMDSAVVGLEAMSESAKVQRTALVARLDQLRDERADYQSRLASSPAVESEFRVLTRDYESALSKYREIRAKLLEANLAQSLEVERKSERFTLIDPPVRSEEPVSPNRLAWLLLNLVLSAAIGIIVATLYASFQRKVFGVEDARELLPNISVVPLPQIKTRAEQRRTKRRIAASVVGSGLAASLAALYVHVSVVPLGTALHAVLLRLGV